MTPGPILFIMWEKVGRRSRCLTMLAAPAAPETDTGVGDVRDGVGPWQAEGDPKAQRHAHYEIDAVGLPVEDSEIASLDWPRPDRRFPRPRTA